MNIFRKYKGVESEDKYRGSSDDDYEISDDESFDADVGHRGILYLTGAATLFLVSALFFQKSSGSQRSLEYDYRVSCIEETINNPDEPLYCTVDNPRKIHDKDICSWNLSGGVSSEFNVDAVTSGYSSEVLSYRVGQEAKLLERGYDLSGAHVFNPKEQKRLNWEASSQIYNKCFEASKKTRKQ